MALSGRDRLTLGLIVAAMVGLVAASWLLPRAPQEIVVLSPPVTSSVGQELAAKYGPGKVSMGPEEWILRELFQDERGGVFVDVCAADARILSNTYYLESGLGWSGIAIDPQTSYAASYLEHRPRTKFRPFFVSDTSDATLPFYVAGQQESSSATREWAERYTRGGAQLTTMTVSTITLDDLLEREGIASFDLLSMDIEGHEMQALAGFSIDRFKPRVVAIEAHPPARQSTIDYFTRAGYALQARYLGVDEFNLYFRRLP
jgi:FkbM family methyltransferase